MQTKPKRPVNGDEQGEADRQTASLAAIVVILLLVIAGLVLVRVLRSTAEIEDCLLAGRLNCGPAIGAGGR